jgi:integrase
MVQRTRVIQANSKNEALQISNAIEADERRILVARQHGETVETFLRHWNANRPDTSRGKPPSKRTIEGDRQNIERIVKHVGSVPLSRVSAGTFDALVAGLRCDGYAPVVVKSSWATLKKSMRQAFRWDKLQSDPSAKAIAPRIPKKEAAFATAEAMHALAGELDGQGKTDIAAAVRLLFVLGLRPSELMALQWRYVDLAAGRVTVCRVASEMPHSFIVVDETKTEASARTIDLPRSAVSVLTAMRERYLAAKAKQGLDWNVDGWLWPGRDEKLPMRPSALAKAFRKAATKIGLEGVNPYAFRHGSATWLIEQGADIKTVQDHLRHTSPALTISTYAHVTDRMKARKLSKFDDLLDGDSSAAAAVDAR